MQGSQFIKVYDNALPDVLCDAVLQRFKEHQGRRISWVGRVSGGYVPPVKLTEDSQLEAGDPLLPEIQRHIVAIRERYHHETTLAEPEVGKWWTRTPFLQHYPMGAGEFKQHVDINAHHYHRRWVYIAYLNDVEEGGETFFPLQNIQVRARKGRVVAFPPLWMFPHGSRKVVSGPKTIMSAIHSIVDEAADV